MYKITICKRINNFLVFNKPEYQLLYKKWNYLPTNKITIFLKFLFLIYKNLYNKGFIKALFRKQGFFVFINKHHIYLEDNYFIGYIQYDEQGIILCEVISKDGDMDRKIEA